MQLHFRITGQTSTVVSEPWLCLWALRVDTQCFFLLINRSWFLFIRSICSSSLILIFWERYGQIFTYISETLSEQHSWTKRWSQNKHAVWIFVFIWLLLANYVRILWEREKGGLGGRSEATEPISRDTSLLLPLLPRTSITTCPNCKEDERIKELRFGCDCKEKNRRRKNKPALTLWTILDYNA